MKRIFGKDARRFRRDDLEHGRGTTRDAVPRRVYVDGALEDLRHGQGHDERRKLDVGGKGAVHRANDDADRESDRNRNPYIFVLSVHQARREHGGQGCGVPHREIETAAPAGNDDHLTQAKERNEGGELHREKDLVEAQEIGHGELPENEQEDDEQNRDDELPIAIESRQYPHGSVAPLTPALLLARVYACEAAIAAMTIAPPTRVWKA